MTMKPLGRMLAKIMHAAPLAVAEQLIRQVGAGGFAWCVAVVRSSGGTHRCSRCRQAPGSICASPYPSSTSPGTQPVPRLPPPPTPQVMGMPGMVTSIVESLKYLTPMAFDVMTFAVLKQLASPKKKLKVSRAGGGPG